MTSGKITSDDIGKTVYLNNSAIDCQEWRIADINHDGTSGTVDLFPKYTLEKGGRRFGSSSWQYYYSDSTLKTWLNGDFYNGFAIEIQNAMKVQNYPSNSKVLSDKVKCPSVNELGCNNDSQYCIAEGTIYPIFGTQQLRINSLATFVVPDSPDGVRQVYWTRSRRIDSGETIFCITGEGYASYTSAVADNVHAMACIRF